MSGTRKGGVKAAKANIERHGKDFYREIGRKGGQNGHSGGFASNPALASIAGAKGGRISRRGKPYDQEYYEQRNKIIKWYAMGVSMRTISNETAIPYSVIRNQLQKERESGVI